jgi:hypothetical protein
MFWHPEWFRGMGRSKWYGDGKPTKRNFISSIIFMMLADNDPLELPVNGLPSLSCPYQLPRRKPWISLASV